MPGRAISSDSLQESSTPNGHDGDEENETSDEEVNEICKQFNLPALARSKKESLIDWESCETCEK